VDITALMNEIEAPSEMDPAVQAERWQRLCVLQAALARLPPKSAEVLLLHRRDGFSLEEIGDQLGISRLRAKKYLRKALIHCRGQVQ
jgi:RNA polymerase sigma factor (sigma-70 family)